MEYRLGSAIVPLSAMPAGAVEVVPLERRISCTSMGFAAGKRAGATYRERSGELLSESINAYPEGSADEALDFARKQWGCTNATDAHHHKWSVARLRYPRIASDQATYRISAADTSGVVSDVIVLRVNDSALLVVTAEGVDSAPPDAAAVESFVRKAFALAEAKLGGSAG